MKMNISLLIITVSLLILKTQGTDSDVPLTAVLKQIAMDFLGKFGDFSGTSGDAQNKDSLMTFSFDVDKQMVLRTLKEIGLGFGGGLGKVGWTGEEGNAQAFGGGFELKFGGCPLDEDTAIDTADSPLFQTVQSLFDGKYGIKISSGYPKSIFRRFGSGTASVHDPVTAELLPCNGKRFAAVDGKANAYLEGEVVKAGNAEAHGCVEGEGSGEAFGKVIEANNANITVKGIGLAYGIGNIEDLAKSKI